MGFISLEQSTSGLKIVCYINNYEVENYFLKGMAFGNHKELQSINGATFFIKRTDFYGSVSSFARKLTRQPGLELRQQPALSPVCPLRAGQDQSLR